MFKVISLDKTKLSENNFNYNYHSKYINQTGKLIDIFTTNDKNNKFNGFMCLEFIINDTIYRDWFDKEDLISV